MLVRRETPADVSRIDAVHRQAFDGPVEADLLHALRADAGWVSALSLVAEDAGGAVVGHVVCTEGLLGHVPVVGLGPVGVLPDVQRTGVGSALMHAVIAAADALDYPLVGLLGHLDYYPRFGFVPASRLGVTAPEPKWGDHFQARPLATWHARLAGTFRYAAPFEAVG
ncbi:MAG TPA: N-acetyltransferase [Acidimicrobiales bacterium]|nr:N-acetyltransferase [Acidimicrobiales bacterium]